jgi:hypothetical protein
MSTSVVEGSKPTEKEIQEWWQWVLSMPLNRSPLRGGEFLLIGQDRLSNWCLTCTGGMGSKGGEDHDRSLDVSKSKKDILIPVFVGAYCKEEVKGKSVHPMDYAKSFVNPNGLSRVSQMPHADGGIEIFLEVNGTPLQPHYMEYGPFQTVLPENHICDCIQMLKDEKPQFYSAGWWLKIPHPSGKGYTIKFGGTNHAWPFHTRVTYHIDG